ncbi:pilus assembly protein [Escherichia coli]|uniref:fimbria/pilus periplasmic chaperone n=1 Tax=Escherichia coli TaxID=562 RepID=UPI000BE5C5E0|nr:fimbria/pilus periplasmic chaperone [Escherichia coli]MIG26164.1 pilus assembly protein [Salmonella enterica subsp. enterica serovar Bredeney]EFA7448300.1 fimbria/pilus periplasmic chaperone [Escherichia coli]EFA7477429.1 fimbria/pilus periplasmic chaperone [Escherichia coli]EFA7497252.1 fimbria/pilus periplasmic chaperone [Escherichia coli]EFA7554364.1 fimbria/pilus periplasmic chaperone [Escherichia coli]
MNRCGILIAVWGLLGFPLCNAATNMKIETASKSFILHLGATRVIYDPSGNGSTLSIYNNQDYPMLVQSEVLTEDKKNKGDFLTTPPLFRLDGLQSSRLRIVKTGGYFPEDRESLQWLCVKGIPPKTGDKWAENKNEVDSKVSLQMNFSVKSCIKLIIRPKNIKGNPEDVAGSLSWEKKGNKLKGINPTPFYMNLSELSVGGREVESRHYISPFSSYEYDIPVKANGNVSWKVITDYGGNSNLFEARLKNQ